jgi:hypothetical protein
MIDLVGTLAAHARTGAGEAGSAAQSIRHFFLANSSSSLRSYA